MAMSEVTLVGPAVFIRRGKRRGRKQKGTKEQYLQPPARCNDQMPWHHRAVCRDVFAISRQGMTSLTCGFSKPPQVQATAPWPSWVIWHQSSLSSARAPSYGTWHILFDYKSTRQ